MNERDKIILEAFHKWYDRPVPKMDNSDWGYYDEQRESWIAAVRWLESKNNE